ncbi:MAG: hypothetical protein CMJ33_05820 [Phycisphaerae bacterium]|nr:hypothetical protein [Phycisphaerae bacterium]HAW96891.1 hypothetical protein [Phycisphaerales bacterium]
MTAAIFLDRDDTLISNGGDLGDPAAVVMLDGVITGLERLSSMGFELVVVTNQGGVARGRYGEKDVELVHERLQQLVGETTPLHFYYCPFHPNGTVAEYAREHPWRKPAPGMFYAAAQQLGLDLSRCWVIGDQHRDMDAGRSAGCRTILFSRPGTRAEERRKDPDHTVKSFEQAVEIIRRAESDG